ncbi:unnamed protein product [Meloidogyne enterolobii]|uniref:Uncharacterized protein n=1 Tax=Meloidogyne enterolobii TaxID=390850 RepID=A0ACB1AKW0_MELEN
MYRRRRQPRKTQRHNRIQLVGGWMANGLGSGFWKEGALDRKLQSNIIFHNATTPCGDVSL